MEEIFQPLLYTYILRMRENKIESFAAPFVVSEIELKRAMHEAVDRALDGLVRDRLLDRLHTVNGIPLYSLPANEPDRFKKRKV